MVAIHALSDVTLKLDTDAERPDAPATFAQIADFFALFRGAYAASLRAGLDYNLQMADSDIEPAVAKVRGYVKTLTVSQVNALFTLDLGGADLLAVSIEQHSPLRLGLRGIATALACAVILSGGKFRCFGLEAELPPIGHGIAELRRALAPVASTVLAYTLRPTQVRLNIAEYTELMSFDPATRTRGGFQRFLIGLQFRIDRRSRLLELSDSDVDMILRHGSQPKKGGWQASINRIFGRHFELNARLELRGM